MPKLLIVADIPGWAYDRMYAGLKNYTTWQVDITYINLTIANKKQDVEISEYSKYDLVFYLCDYNPLLLHNAKIPRHKVIFGIRSWVNHPFYNNPVAMRNICIGVAVANEKLFNRFKHLEIPVAELPGGIDTNFFTESNTPIHDVPVVGWSGTADGQPDKDLRRLGLIQSACDDIGFKFSPALREEKWRTPQEMVSYYHNDIDIYIDASKSAGRQNGLLEASSCGKPVIGTNVGSANKIIKEGFNGYIIEPTKESIKSALIKSKNNFNTLSKRSREYALDKWSWNTHAKLFGDFFQHASKTAIN